METSKIQILAVPRMAPGTCVVCGTSRSDDRQYIDLGLTVEFVGVIYFCTFCMRELANQLGCLMPEQTQALEAELDAARQRILEFNTKESALDGAINTLRDTGLFAHIDINAISVIDDLKPQQDALDFSESDKQELDGTGIDPEQSDSKQESDGVPSSTSDDYTDFEF